MRSIDVLEAICAAIDKGDEPDLILAEDSPLMEQARDLIRPRPPYEPTMLSRMDDLVDERNYLQNKVISLEESMERTFDDIAVLRQENAKMRDIGAMVSRFLCWRLPKDFAPDGRVKFDRIFLVFDGFDGAQPIDISDAPDHYWPTGTNLFTAEQAKAMIENMLGIGPTKDMHKLPPSEQECEHRKITYCHGSSLWICADCDEGFAAGEFMGLQLVPPTQEPAP